MAVYIHEFLYRGRAAGSAEPPAWHVTLASTGVDDFGEPVRSGRTLTMAAAQEAGWGLPDIIAAINADAMNELEARRGEIAELTAKLEQAERRAATPD